MQGLKGKGEEPVVFQQFVETLTVISVILVSAIHPVS